MASAQCVYQAWASVPGGSWRTHCPAPTPWWPRPDLRCREAPRRLAARRTSSTNTIGRNEAPIVAARSTDRSAFAFHRPARDAAIRTHGALPQGNPVGNPGTRPRVCPGAEQRRGEQASYRSHPTEEGAPNVCHDRNLCRRCGGPAIHDPGRLRGGTRDAARPHHRHPLARPRTRRRLLAGRPAGGDPGTRPLLGNRVRHAPVRSPAGRPAALRHRDRRAGHSLHPRPLAARERAAGHHHPRVARLGHRTAERHRPARQPHRARRELGGCLRRGNPVDAGLRVLASRGTSAGALCG